MALDLPTLVDVLDALSRKRVAYHSEADFQHALAWQIQTSNPALGVRLEVPFEDPKGEIDILVRGSVATGCCGIELKYARGPLDLDIQGERFRLKGNDPKDVARYAFWSDVRRLERWLERAAIQRGFAVLLANDPGCWSPGRRPANDDRFRFHEGARVESTLDWVRPPRQENPGDPIRLSGQYECRWRNFGTVPDARYGEFRVLVVEAQSANG